MFHGCWWQVTIHVITKRKSSSWTKMSANSAHMGQSPNGENNRPWEWKATGHSNPSDSQRMLNSFKTPSLDGSWPATLSKLLLPMKGREVTRSHSNQQHVISLLFPQPFFFPFLSSLALDHWCKNFKQHQPWCNSTWFTGSWRLFFSSHHAEWQMLWRSCSCPDKFQVKIKVTEATSCRNKSWGRKNLEPPLEFR